LLEQFYGYDKNSTEPSLFDVDYDFLYTYVNYYFLFMKVFGQFMSLVQHSALTPLMQQYFDIRIEFDDALLLFQVGDFYELFFDDAKKASLFLGIALTKRGSFNNEPIPLCGFPIHVLDHYVTKLVKGGFKVALCQQLEQATAGKMVSRGVTQVFTPGTLTSETLLDAKTSSYLFSFFPAKDSWGLIFSELLTSQIHVTMLPCDEDRSLETELFRFLPDEVLLQAQSGMGKFEDFFKKRGFFTTRHNLLLEQTKLDELKQWSKQQFSESSFEALHKNSSIESALALWYFYLSKNQNNALQQFKEVNFYTPDQFLLLDPATQKNLDIVKNNFDGSKKNSLIASVDRAVTPMGSRMIRRWLLRPLVEKDVILQRQDVIAFFVNNHALLLQLIVLLEQFGDLQRIVGRIALQKSGNKDYIQLGRIVGLMPQLRQLLQSCDIDLLQQCFTSFIDFSELHNLLIAACYDDDIENWIIKNGFDEHLDYLRECIAQSSQKVLDLEAVEQKRSGINSLKIRQNSVHGYYIEVTKAQSNSVPADYVRQQTLVGRERYTMPILQQIQSELMLAENSINIYEKELFQKIKDRVAHFILPLRQSAEAIAIIDALLGLAHVAYDQGYVKPEFNNDRDIIIQDGKHPVIAMQLTNQFIANDTNLTDAESLWIVTGPNMGGKSTYLRQTALICILAQTGSFVPARFASLPLLDRVFTRIGAGDNLAEGKSTFLVEMEETAQICLQATKNSLVILDEVGRGTSTFDGLALAQAVVEYIHEVVQARCLFATHYHELTYLQDHYRGIVNYYADSKKTDYGILFLHKIIKGIAHQSFGLEVAKLANLPYSLIVRAEQLLEQFERKDNNLSQLNFLPVQKIVSIDHDWKHKYQTVLHKYDEQAVLIEKIKKIDCDNLSPKQAFDLLWNLQQDMKDI